ncbi:hypothetical protein NFI96_003965 [Prochilodus magdalenae]|nr:hypothetical protein NFI96_003965 [Prochilodus magdalenae]
MLSAERLAEHQCICGPGCRNQHNEAREGRPRVTTNQGFIRITSPVLRGCCNGDLAGLLCSNRDAMSQAQECLTETGHGGESGEVRKQRFSWTVDKEEKLVELWSEPECLFDVSSHFYHDRVEKERWTEIAEAFEIPGANASPSHGLETSQTWLLRPTPEPEDVHVHPDGLLRKQLYSSLQNLDLRSENGKPKPCPVHAQSSPSCVIHPMRLEYPHTVPGDGAVGVEVEGHQTFWTNCLDKPSILVLTTVPPHTDSLGVSTKTKARLVTEDDPLPFGITP